MLRTPVFALGAARRAHGSGMAHAVTPAIRFADRTSLADAHNSIDGTAVLRSHEG